MSISTFKIGDRVKLTRGGGNASQFNKALGNPLGVYEIQDWASKVFYIEGTIKLTDFSDPHLSKSAHLLKDREGNIVGYVYTEALTVVNRTWSYSVPLLGIKETNLEASNLKEAKRIALGMVKDVEEELNIRLKGFTTINVGIKDILIKEVI
jgi:hypothetical protein